MPVIRRRFLQAASASAALALRPRLARAQTYPVRPVRVIVTSGPGGQSDLITRLFAQKLSEGLGREFYVENIAGGGGNIAMGTAARSAPDGYTILAAAGNFVINPSLYAKIPYDPQKDFAPVSLLCASTHVLVVHPSVAADTAKAFIALAKANPGKFSYASAGRGTPAHLAGELFKLAFGLDITHVPFGGGGPGIAATVGGHVPLAVSALPTALPYVKAGNVRALAMMSAKRTPLLPDVPTMAEATGENLQADILTGFLVRAGTAQAIVELLHGEVVKALAAPDFRARLAALGFDPVGSTPEGFTDWINAEMPKWAKVIQGANIARQ
jgi:tripartite-type tricarboxylate transporter receptor subunit TctC